MTQRNKLIVGGLVVVGALYLYDRNRKMKAVKELKAGAETVVEEAEAPTPIVKTIASVDAQKELNFAGSNKKGISAQYFR